MNSPASVLDRFLDPFTECLTPEVAQRVADLRPDAATQARIDELGIGRLLDDALDESRRTISALTGRI